MVYKLITSSIIFLIIIGSGVWLSTLGNPYGVFLLNIHKLIALAFLVYIFLISKNLFQSTKINPFHWVFIVAAIISVVLIFVSGGILSRDEFLKTSLATIHKISSATLFLALIGWFFTAIKIKG